VTRSAEGTPHPHAAAAGGCVAQQLYPAARGWNHRPAGLTRAQRADIPYEYDVRIGFVGAGLMGSEMVRNLAEAGHDVRLYARTPERARGLPATLVAGAREAADGAEVLCSIVTDSDDVRAIVIEALRAERPPQTIIEMSTIAPAVARELAEAAAERGVAYLDCPVSGGPPGAAAGTLAIMCGGDATALERVAPVLDVLGDPDRRTHCGPVGAGLAAKLVNNLLVAVISAGTAEALGVGQRAGLDPALLREVVLGASGASWQLENLFPRVLAGDHRPGFKAKDLRKDLGHLRDLAGEPLPIGDVAAALFADLPDDVDYGAVARRFMELPEP
jgi:3-hydroxyisobutyrate dehydrogenase-like beta-hydroxyacid dehydrogenase